MTDSQKAVRFQNPRETGRFRRGEAKGHRFIELPVFITEGGQDPAPTKEGLAVALHLWPKVKKRSHQLDAALVQGGWPEEEKLTLEGE